VGGSGNGWNRMRGSPWLGLWARLRLGQCWWAVVMVLGNGGRGWPCAGEQKPEGARVSAW
jgi:hypothetical protein